MQQALAATFAQSVRDGAGGLTAIASKGQAKQRTLNVSDADRLKAFGTARRHTSLVSMLRYVLPLTMAALVGTYGVLLGGHLFFANSGLQFERQEITANDLKMINPNYRGQTKDGGQFEVRAREATVNLAMTGPITLDHVEADLVDAKGVTTKVTGLKGVVDRAKSTIDLTDGVTLDASNGMTARMQRAHINTKENRIVGAVGVTTAFPTGTVRADAMDFLTKARKGTYTGNVIVDLKPSEPPAAPGAAPGATPEKEPGPKQNALGFGANSRDPITVRAERLDIDDGARRADFLGQVTAVQGETKIDAETLHLDYEGQPAKASNSPGAKKDQIASLLDPGQSTGRLRRMQAHNNVVITSAQDRRISANAADFDVLADKAVLTGNVFIEQGTSTIRATRLEAHQKADTALLTGNVLVEQGPNKLSGERLAIDRKKGEARLDSPAEAGKPAGRIQTTFVQQQAVPGSSSARIKSAPKPDAKPERANPLAGAFGGLKADTSAPLDVEADVLDLFDVKKVAVFKGSVTARQGEMHLKAAEMHAFYTGEGSLLADAAPQRKSKPPLGTDAKPVTQLTRVEARNGVTIDAKDGQSASGDKATFDIKANTLVLEGNVTLTQGKNIINCERARMDLTSNVMRCEREQLVGTAPINPAPPIPGAPVQAPAAPIPTPSGQQMRMVIFPKDLREKQQARDAEKKAAPVTAPSEKAAPKRSAPARDSSVAPSSILSAP